MVKIWRPDLDYGCADVLDFGHKDGGIGYNEKGILLFDDSSSHALRSQPIPTDYSGLWMEISLDPPEARPAYFSSGSLFMVSGSLRSVLDDLKVNVQYTRFNIICDGKELPDWGYYYCNIIDLVDCFDLDSGEYTFWKKEGFLDHVDEIKKLAIDERKAVGYHLFRIAKGGEYIICVSDDLANRINEREFRGIKFI